jgi:hypothetical protein
LEEEAATPRGAYIEFEAAAPEPIWLKFDLNAPHLETLRLGGTELGDRF